MDIVDWAMLAERRIAALELGRADLHRGTVNIQYSPGLKALIAAQESAAKAQARENMTLDQAAALAQQWGDSVKITKTGPEELQEVRAHIANVNATEGFAIPKDFVANRADATAIKDMSKFIARLLDPEDLGHNVPGEVRKAAGIALGLKIKEQS